MAAKPHHTVAKLRREYAKLGLPNSGKRADLVRRLQDCRISATAPTPADSSSSDEDFIGCWVATTILSHVSDAIEMARQKLIDAAQNDTLQEETLRNDDRVITNRRGGFLSRMREDLDDVCNKLAILDEKLEATTARLTALTADHTVKTEALFAKTDELERTAVGFRDFRNKFIGTYKRDILQDYNDENINCFNDGDVNSNDTTLVTRS